jgi:hypothetical protein
MNVTLVGNVLSALVGFLAVFGVKLDLSPEVLAQFVGGLVAAVAIVNQIVHVVRDRKAA